MQWELFCQQTQKTHSYNHLVTAEPLSQESAVCTKQGLQSEYSTLPSVTTHSSFTKSVVMSIAVSKLGLASCWALCENSMTQWTVLVWYLNKCYLLSNVLSTTLFAFQQHSSCMHQRMVCTALFNSCCAKPSTSFLLSYGPPPGQRWTQMNYEI